MRCFLLILVALFGSPAIAQDRPVPAKEAPKRISLPEGFTATLFAGEPDIVQPIAFTFDDRGRLWVVECLSYPKWTEDGSGKDRVTLLEDSDGDGIFDKKQVIVDTGSNLSGIELGFGGIWLCSIPNLLFLPCEFNPDAPKPGKAQVLLDGWSLKCKHNVYNSLTWGPDGWLYGCNGIIDTSYVGKPGTPKDQRIPMNCGVWRYHPVKHVFQPFGHGTTNPFGLDFDDYGELFITNCVIHHLWHVLPGSHFERMHGQHLNKHVFALMQSCADHIHWGGGDWTSSRGGKGVHSEAGGGHAHSGCMIYLGGSFPQEYRNGVFACNIHGNRVNHDRLERRGGGYVARHEKDFFHANDPWFRGICIKYGPDGGVYVSDWCDTGECHNYDKADITNGRIFKITYGQNKQRVPNLASLSDAELIEYLPSRAEWYVRHAQRLLHERSLPGAIATQRLEKWLEESTDIPARLRCLWTLDMLKPASIPLYRQMFHHADPIMRGWGVRLAAQALPDDKEIRTELTQLASKEADVSVRRRLASSLHFLSLEGRRDVGSALLAHSKLVEDADAVLLTWYGIEPVVAMSNAAGIDRLLERAVVPQLQQFIGRRLALRSEAELTGILPTVFTRLRATKTGSLRLQVLRGLLEGLAGSRKLTPPEGWKALYASLLEDSSPEVRGLGMRLAVLYGDTDAITDMRKLAENATEPPARRIAALQALVESRVRDTEKTLDTLMGDPALRSAAIRGLAAFNNPETAEKLLKVYANLSEAEKDDVVQTLAARPTWALALLDAIEKGTVPRSAVSAFTARQIQGLKNQQVSERLTKVWGQLKPASQERAALTKKYKELLTETFLAKADLSRGRLVYSKNCAACHRLYDDGGNIGPALTGSQRSNLDYVLENVLDPSAVVPRDYQMVKIETASGRFINGIIRAETDRALTVQTQNEQFIVSKEDIVSREQQRLSLMPDGILEKLSPEEVRDLIAYLRSKDQVPLPK